MQRQSVRNLPAHTNPTGTRCITIEIPDDDEWEQAAFSELYRLALWMLWERNAGHDGAPVAKRWRKALATWAHCDGSPTPIPDEWIDDMSICESLRWHGGVLQGYCCGEWTDIPTDDTGPIPGGGTQPSSGTRPAAGASTCFTRSLQAGDAFLLPFGVQNGDIVTVTELSGAWSNDGIRWTCTDGTPFALGLCAGSRYHDGGDPDATLYHGQLALQMGTTYVSATDGPVTLAGLLGTQSLVVRPNFVPGGGAGGTVQFKICVTNGAVVPTAPFCYTLTPSNWAPYMEPQAPPPPDNCLAVIDGSGIHGCCLFDGSSTDINLKVNLPTPTNITSVLVTYQSHKTRDNGLQDQIKLHSVDAFGGTLENYDIGSAVGEYSGTVTFVHTLTGVTSFGLTGYARETHCADGSYFTILQIVIQGTGTNPFGASNC